MEKAVADKRKKLVRAIPTTIPGVSAVVRGDARSDIREIEALVDMQVCVRCRRRHHLRTFYLLPEDLVSYFSIPQQRIYV